MGYDASTDIKMTAPDGSTIHLRGLTPKMAPLATGIEKDDTAADPPKLLKGTVHKTQKPDGKPPLKGGVQGSGHKPKQVVVTETPHPPLKQPEKPKDQSPKPMIIPAKLWQEIKCFMLGKVQKHRAGQPTGDHTFDSAPGYEAAGVFDYAGFWGNGNEDKDFTFDSGPHKGVTYKGHEVNYYFQGMIARAYGVDRGKLEGIIRLWKLRYLSQPSDKTLQMAREGYDNYEKDLADCKQSKQ